jgi:hypothetical protein
VNSWVIDGYVRLQESTLAMIAVKSSERVTSRTTVLRESGDGFMLLNFCGLTQVLMSVLCRVLIAVTLVLVFMFGPASCRAGAVDSVDDLTGPWQLLVDDYPVVTKSNVVRTYHPFQKYAGNPVLIPDTAWEQLTYLYGTVLPNETRTGYRMWYQTLRTNDPCGTDSIQLYATSTNGINWAKPALYQHAWCGSTSNNLYYQGFMTSVMQTPDDPDPAKRYKFMNLAPDGWAVGWSSNGINVVSAPNNPVFTGGGDSGQICWDPRTEEYRCYVKTLWFDTNALRRRAVGLARTANFTNWPGSAPLVLWPDAVDDRWSSNPIQRTHFYGMSVFSYETMYLGFLWIHRGTNLLGDLPGYQVGPIHVELVSSHDGVNWTREEGNRPALLALGANGTWDDGMVFTARAPVVEGDTIKLWYGGFDQVHDAGLGRSHSAIGLATLRKDGFASLDAGATIGTILTRTLTGVGGPLRVNYRAVGGSLKVEVLDENNNVLPGYSQADCVALNGDSVDQTITWAAHAELPAGVTLLRLRFILQNASVFSFMAGESAAFPQTPTITQQPASRTNAVGSVATFSIQAAGAPAPDYQWQKNEANLSDGGHYSGCTNATLTITGADNGDAASYRCLVTNIFGSATSSPATLTVEDATCLAIGNSDFENGFSLAGGGYIANDWTEWEAAPGVTIGYDETAITHGGMHSQRIRVWGTNSTSGGVYQRLPMTVGQPYTVSVWVYAGDDLSACSLGVDPAGGTNATSGVIWSSATTNVSWVQKTLTGTATADHLTVFYKVASSDSNKRNGYFDDASPAGEAAPLQLLAQLNGNTLTLTWPQCPGARLERTESLAAPVSWTTDTNQVSTLGGRKSVTLSPQGGTACFRLRQDGVQP